MLPRPVSYHRSKGLYEKLAIHANRSCLRSRARITNLGLILLSLTTISLLILNVLNHLEALAPPNSILSTFFHDEDGLLADLNHLIIVPGHAIWQGADAQHRLDDSLWILEPYQRGGGHLEAFYQHIAHAAKLSLQDQHSLLVFSGGQTRQGTTTTEAESYMRLALQSGVLPNTGQPIRATTENYALDSYQNLLFSIARFHEYAGVYPSKITIVGYEMKRRRFTDLHRAAIRWPEYRFEYLGIDSVYDEDSAVSLEKEGHVRWSFEKDLYGCHSDLLQKRRARNLYRRVHPYHTSSPELRKLLEWCEPGLYDGILPWVD